MEKIYNVDYHITDKCNLNCAHCNHFCPLVPSDTKHKSIEQIISDLSLLSKFKDNIENITILGGEPTLHPELSKILRIARQLFPNNNIFLFTNGTRVDIFYKWIDAIVENDIKVSVTYYPYTDNAEEKYNKLRDIIPSDKLFMAEFPKEFGFTYNIFSKDSGVASDFEIKECIRRHRCNQLKDGKLYICHYIAQFDYLKKAFPDINISMNDCNYIDLNGDVSYEDVYNFIMNSHPAICDHCLDAHYWAHNGPTEPWRKSNKELNEWYQ